ncbi:hypothetical protein PMAYCL1PPCAC_13802, partial [Pristionchus mayeri]
GMVLDYSPEAIEGRIFFDVPRNVRSDEIRALLEPFGPIIEFSIKSTFDGGRVAFAKLQSNDAADEAVYLLNPAILGSGLVRVRRAVYWARSR